MNKGLATRLRLTLYLLEHFGSLNGQMQMVATLEGSDLIFLVDGYTLIVNSATGTAADTAVNIRAIHQIDGVLVPVMIKKTSNNV